MLARDEIIDTSLEKNNNQKNNDDDYDSDDDSSSVDSIGCGRDFAFEILSDSFFIIGSILYTWLFALGIKYAKQMQHIPYDVYYWESDDDYTWYKNVTEAYPEYEDDYVIQGPWISKYQIVYFFAALAFVFSGIFSALTRCGGFHILISVIFICASLCGMTSAILIESNEDKSKLLNLISVHIYLIQGPLSYYARKNQLGRSVKVTGFMAYLLFGELCFIFGALFDVIQSWCWTYRYETVSIAYLGMACGIFWLINSIIITSETLCWGLNCYPDMITYDVGDEEDTKEYISGEQTHSVEQQAPVKTMEIREESKISSTDDTSLESTERGITC
mmetsp:Transcript_9136/g.10064  ORF Transcript_9136/g.10064 Transcript_9136/m.10064 type:complete len:332 (-) Transcript_9136:187-1182(-)